MTNGSAPSTATPPSKSFDYGNPLCTLLFASLGAESALRHSWIFCAIWSLFAISTALMMGGPGLSGQNWKKPRALLACALLLAASAALLVNLTVELFAPVHP